MKTHCSDPGLVTVQGYWPLDYTMEKNNHKCIEVLTMKSQTHHVRNLTVGNSWYNSSQCNDVIEDSNRKLNKTQRTFPSNMLNQFKDDCPLTKTNNNSKVELIPSIVNYSNLSNLQKNKKNKIERKSSLTKPDSSFNEANKSSYTLDFEGNRQFTFQLPDSVDEIDENMQSNTNDMGNRRITPFISKIGTFPLMGGYSYITKSKGEGTNVIQVNFQSKSNDRSNPLRNARYSFSNENCEKMKENRRCAEYFINDGQMLAIFTSVTNDIECFDYHTDQKKKESSTEEYEDNLEEETVYHSSGSNEVLAFLNQIGMARYSSLMIKQGFDDVKLIIEQMKTGDVITDQNLKDAGIGNPGDRARILIKLEEDSESFNFSLPGDDVYYSAGCEESEMMKDHHVKCIYSWLSHLKIEKYTRNFFQGGYHSLELMYTQMGSKNPITDKILDEELKISKIGYRIRILNKLKDDSRTFINELKSARVDLENQKQANHGSCRCLIY